jgi:hypothetical protein
MQPDKNHLRARRRTALLAVVAGITLLTAACGNGGTSPHASGSASPSATSPAELALAYAKCMRAHGVTTFPDPTINGNSVSSSGSMGNVSQAVVQAAQGACRALSPQNFVPPGVNPAQNAAQALKWAQCIREHGVPNWPDPNGNGTFSVSGSIDLQGAAYLGASKACQSVRPRSLGISQDQGPSS